MIRGRLLAVLDVVLRVPPVFLIDSIFMTGFGDWSKLLYPVTIDSGERTGTSFGEYASNNTSFISSNDSDPLSSSSSSSASPAELHQVMRFLMYMSTIFASLAVFLLPTKSLVSFYLWLVSIVLILWSYVSNESYIIFMSGLSRSSLAHELFQFQDWNVWYRLICNYFLQVFLSLSFCYLSSRVHRKDCILSKRIVAVSFIIPTIISLLPGSLPSTSKSWINLFASDHITDANDSLYRRIRALSLALSPITALSLSLFYIVVNVVFHAKIVATVLIEDIQWSRTIVRHYGIYTLIENQWARLHVPQVN
jgi:hypothetical protein